jgi:hypothetical protein
VANFFTVTQPSNVESIQVGLTSSQSVSVQVAIYTSINYGSYNLPDKRIYLSPITYYPSPSGYFVHTENLSPQISLAPANYFVAVSLVASGGTQSLDGQTGVATGCVVSPAFMSLSDPFPGGAVWVANTGFSIQWNLCY